MKLVKYIVSTLKTVTYPISKSVGNDYNIITIEMLNIINRTITINNIKFDYVAPTIYYECHDWDGDNTRFWTSIQDGGIGLTSAATIRTSHTTVPYSINSNGTVISVTDTYQWGWAMFHNGYCTIERNSNPRSYSCLVQTSNDNTNWTTIDTITINETAQNFTYSEINASYIRLLINTSDNIGTTISGSVDYSLYYYEDVYKAPNIDNELKGKKF